MTRLHLLMIAAVACVACSADDAVTPPISATKNLGVARYDVNPHLFDGIHLSSEERERFFSINHRYNERIRALRNAQKNPRDPVDPAIVSKLRALRSAQIAEWRGAMTPEHLTQFDRNRQSVDAHLAELRSLHAISRAGH